MDWHQLRARDYYLTVTLHDNKAIRGRITYVQPKG
jgi:ribosomal protein L30/L7E